MSNPKVNYKEGIGWKFINYDETLMNIFNALLNQHSVLVAYKLPFKLYLTEMPVI